MTLILNAALAHLEQVHPWSVIPVGNDKKPVGSWKVWQSRAMTPDEAKTAFKSSAVKGLAVVCGAVSNLTVLDFEEHSLEIPEVQAILELCKTVPRARSGGGGVHLFFASSGERNKSLELQGVHVGDVRGEGGYIVLPPSAHPSGNTYQWVNEPKNELEPICEALQAMLEQFTQKAQTAPNPMSIGKTAPQVPINATSSTDAIRTYALAALEKETQNVYAQGCLPKGTGNQQIFSSAKNLGQLIQPGALSESEVWTAIENAVQSWQNPDPNARTSIRSGLDAGKKKPRDLSNIGNKLSNPKTQKTGKNSSANVAAPLGQDQAYKSENGVICKLERAKNDSPEYFRALCNFNARIVAETIRDDGESENQNFFTIEGALWTGEKLPTVDIPSGVFNALNWVTKKWGARVTIQPTQNTKGFLAHGIQTLSIKEGFGTRRVYTHTGWRKLEKHGWAYLHAGGGITAKGNVSDLEIDLGKLDNYRLTEPATDTALIESITASLECLTLAPDRVTLPLWLGIVRAALGVTRFSIFLYGVTGEAKSGVAAMMLCHYGKFSRYSLPENWESTATKLEKTLFTVKDAPCVIDDFNPRGSTQEAKGLNSKADRVLRNQGNGSARGRGFYAEGGTVEDGVSYVPRGLCIVTGEDIPSGQSLRARNLILEVNRGNVKREALAKLNPKADSGVLSAGMAAFLQWLAPNLEQHQSTLATRAIALALTFTASHGRTTDAAGDLMATLEIWGAFALEKQCITESELEALTSRARTALQFACGAQAEHQNASDPVHRFLDILPALFSSGKAYLKDSSTGQAPKNPSRWGWVERTYGTNENQRTEWQSQGAGIGWLTEQGSVLLEPQAAYAAVQRFAGEQGDSIPKSAQATWKAMSERGLVVKGAGQNTVSKRIEGTFKKVLCLHPHALEIEEETNADPPTLLKNSHISHTTQTDVLDNSDAVTALSTVTAKTVTAPNISHSADSSTEAVTEQKQSQQNISHGSDTVQHSVKTPVTDVTANKHSTPLGVSQVESISGVNAQWFDDEVTA